MLRRARSNSNATTTEFLSYGRSSIQTMQLKSLLFMRVTLNRQSNIAGDFCKRDLRTCPLSSKNIPIVPVFRLDFDMTLIASLMSPVWRC